MSRYFFHLRTGNGLELTDEEGDELPTLEAVEEQATVSAMELCTVAALEWMNCSFEVHDQNNRHVMTAWFRDALLLPSTDTTAGVRNNDQHAN